MAIVSDIIKTITLPISWSKRLARRFSSKIISNPTRVLEILGFGSLSATLIIGFGVGIEIYDKWGDSRKLIPDLLEDGGLIIEALLILFAIYVTRAEKRESDEKLAEANVRAAEANARAKEATLELAKFRAPRRLTREQISRIEEILKKFEDVRFSINLTGLDGEIGGIAAALANILTEIGWKLERWPFTLPGQIEAYITLNRLVTVGGVAVNNVCIWYPLHIPDVLSAGQGLGMALAAEGVVTTWEPTLLDKSIVLIAIGPKM